MSEVNWEYVKALIDYQIPEEQQTNLPPLFKHLILPNIINSFARFDLFPRFLSLEFLRRINKNQENRFVKINKGNDINIEISIWPMQNSWFHEAEKKASPDKPVDPLLKNDWRNLLYILTMSEKEKNDLRKRQYKLFD